MTSFAFLFEAKSVQEYILRSGRLRHIVGASELLDSLAPDLLNDVLDALGLGRAQDLRFSREGGGAVYLFADSEGQRNAFADLWCLAVRQYAPGLEFVVATGEGMDDYQAFRNAHARLLSARNRQPPMLPAGTPVTRYAPRTGEPAVKQEKTLGLQDRATARFGLRQYWRKEKGGLTGRFAPELPGNAWPRNLDCDPEDPDGAAFPFLPDNRYLGLLHADGNGLGQLLMGLQYQVRAAPAGFVPLFRDFSTAVRETTLAAARHATETVLLPARGDADDDRSKTGAGLIPARPIVLGGDDLTILLRADLAVPFARAFLTWFEVESRTRIEQLRARHPAVAGILPECLTAGGGIAFVKSNHPFHLAHELAEGLAKAAKDRAKEARTDGEGRIAPTLAFHRVTTACHGDYAEILRTEMTCGPAQDPVVTTLGAYGLDDDCHELPALADLEALTALLAGEDMARGPARRILTLLGQDHDEARRHYARWREVMGQRHKDKLKGLDELLGRLCGAVADDLPVSADRKRVTGDLAACRTPLGDAAALLAVTYGSRREVLTTEEAA
jgi:hypothetical protein